MAETLSLIYRLSLDTTEAKELPKQLERRWNETGDEIIRRASLSFCQQADK